MQRKSSFTKWKRSARKRTAARPRPWRPGCPRPDATRWRKAAAAADSRARPGGAGWSAQGLWLPRNATLRCLRDVRPETANGGRRATSPPQVPSAGCTGARGCAVPARTAARGQAERRFQQDVVREAVLLPHISEDPSPVTFSTMLQRFQSVLSLPIA